MHRGLPYVGWLVAPLATGLLIGAPLLVVLAHAGGLFSSELRHLAATVLPRYAMTTVALVVVVTSLTAVIGISTAWLITAYRFPGRKPLSWLLALPLAIPTYVGATAYTGIFDFAGPAQLFFRQTLGMDAGAYPVIAVRGFGGLTIVLTALLYPYVYLTARAAFTQQGSTLVEVTRSLGSPGIATFFRAVLPATRPALAAGLILVVMEVLGEFGASHHLGVDTLTIGIFRSWFGLGSVSAALAMGAVLLAIVGLIQLIECRGRRGARYCPPALHDRPLSRKPLHGRHALGALTVCGLPALFGFALPAAQLLWWTLRSVPAIELSIVLRLTMSSVGLAAMGTAVVVLLAILVAYAARLRGDRLVAVLARWASTGYAVPAAVLAVGIATVYAWADRRLNAAIFGVFGVSPGLILSASGLALLAGYIVRFFAVGYHAIESGLSRIPTRFDEVGRATGLGPGGGLFLVALPNVQPALLTAGVLLVVEMLKELPLTLILRPFHVETLATNVFRLAGNEQLAESAPFALAIIAIGLAPVLVLTRILPGRRRSAAVVAGTPVAVAS